MLQNLKDEITWMEHPFLNEPIHVRKSLKNDLSDGPNFFQNPNLLVAENGFYRRTNNRNR